MIRILDLPVPLIAAIASLQLPDGVIERTPGYVIGAGSAIFLIVYVLKAMGKMPGQSEDEREVSFTDEDRVLLVSLAAALTTEDSEGFQRFNKMNERVKETHETIDSFVKIADKLVVTIDSIEAHMKVISEDIQRRV